MLTDEILKKNLNKNLLSVFRAEENPDPNKHTKKLREYLNKKPNFIRNKISNHLDATHNKEIYLGNYDYDPSDPKQATGLIIGSPLKSNFETPDNKTKPNPKIMRVDPDQEHDPYSIFSKFDPINSPIKSSNNSGGKSKRRKSKTKSCCSVRKSAKVCRRKTDNKKFRLPRRFSRKTCLAKKPRGFTMRSSCAPYKGCKKTRKGGTRENKKKRKKEGPSDDDIFHLYDNPVSANFMSKLFENTDHLSEKDAGIYRENMEKEMIKKAKKLISNLSVEQEDMLLKLSKKIEEESRGGRKK
jgi:hypothetical protein